MDIHAQNLKPAYQTARLSLRPLVRADAGPLVTLIDNFAVSKWLTHVPHPYVLTDGEDFIAAQAKATGRVWAIEQSTNLIGVIGISKELGYWLGQPFWGHGYMSEATACVVNAYFNETEKPSLVSGHFLENKGSRRVLKKLGFEDTHVGEAHSLARGETAALQRMCLTREKWIASHG